MDLSQFKQTDFLSALKTLFRNLNVPINYVSDDPIATQEILKDTYKENESFKLINDIYFLEQMEQCKY